MAEIKHVEIETLEAGLGEIRGSPSDAGVLKLIVRRPQTEAREILEEGELSMTDGLIGDNWRTRGSSRTPDGSANPAAQLTIMNSRVIALLAQQNDRWALAGDQLYLDMDLSAENMPPGTRLAIGSAVIEVSSHPHTGCHKFKDRFGPAAVSFVNSPDGKKMRLRGLNARIITPGVIRVGDIARKVPPT